MMKKVLLIIIILSLFISLTANEYLSINKISALKKLIVYELADDEHRDEAVKYIKNIGNWLKVPVYDLKSMTEDEKKEKLNVPFLFYTVLDSAAAPTMLKMIMPLKLKRIDINQFSLGNISAKGSDFRFIFVSKNPFSKGYCTVYAALNNKLIKGFNNLFHGSHSYHLYSGNKLKKEGDYTENFVFKKETLPLHQGITDVRTFFHSLEDVHPNLLAKIGPDEYLKLKTETVSYLVKKASSKKLIGMRDLGAALYRAAAFFHDGHTSVHWSYTPNCETEPQTKYPPFILDFKNDSFIIRGSLDTKLLKGSRILKVNGQLVKDWLKPVLDRCSGEILPFKAARFINRQLFLYSITGFLNQIKTLDITFEQEYKKERSYRFKSVGFNDFSKLADQFPRKKKSRKLSHKFYNSNKICYIYYPAFIYSNEQKNKISAIFKEMKQKKTKTLIFDIRGNGGGNSGIGNFIVSHLTKKPFQYFSAGQVKISRQLIEKQPSNYNKYIDLVGLRLNFRNSPSIRSEPEYFFGGDVVTLIDNGTFSSASGFAAIIKDFKIGTLIGYETGGLETSFGDVLTMTLPYSGIEYGVSHKLFFGPIHQPGDDEHGVLPHIPVNDKLLNSFKSDKDPILSFALEYIRKISNH